jgi:hypothetical protein
MHHILSILRDCLKRSKAMSYLPKSALSLVLSLVATASVAADTSFMQPAKNTTAANPNAEAVSAYQAKVRAMSQQNKEVLSKEVDAVLPKPITPSTVAQTPPAPAMRKPVTTTTSSPASSQETYTGFGGSGSGSGSSKPQAAPAGGGWKVQY